MGSNHGNNAVLRCVTPSASTPQLRSELEDCRLPSEAVTRSHHRRAEQSERDELETYVRGNFRGGPKKIDDLMSLYEQQN